MQIEFVVEYDGYRPKAESSTREIVEVKFNQNEYKRDCFRLNTEVDVEHFYSCKNVLGYAFE